MRNFLILTLIVLLVTPFNSVFSQESSENYGLEEIVVTAQKREDTIQTVPIAITAISGDVLVTMKPGIKSELCFPSPNTWLKI